MGIDRHDVGRSEKADQKASSRHIPPTDTNLFPGRASGATGGGRFIVGCSGTPCDGVDMGGCDDDVELMLSSCDKVDCGEACDCPPPRHRHRDALVPLSSPFQAPSCP